MAHYGLDLFEIGHQTPQLLDSEVRAALNTIKDEATRRCIRMLLRRKLSSVGLYLTRDPQTFVLMTYPGWSNPTTELVLDDGQPSPSLGVLGYKFAGNVVQSVMFWNRLPIDFHVSDDSNLSYLKWETVIYADGVSQGDKCVFGIEYAVFQIDALLAQQMPDTKIIYSDPVEFTDIPSNFTVTFPKVTTTDAPITPNAAIYCRFFRAVDDPNDNFSGKVIATVVWQEYVKTISPSLGVRDKNDNF